MADLIVLIAINLACCCALAVAALLELPRSQAPPLDKRPRPTELNRA